MNALPGVIPLDGVARDYAWGSRTTIQRLLGLPEDGNPIAELWFGAHPDDPSSVPSHDTTLDAIIAADPLGALGEAALDRFGARLPYLLKILAADKALSIQVHPTIVQAEDGYDREDAAGIARNAANRNYRDRNHKPELLCALSPFEALCGFRPVGATLDLLAELDVPELAFVAEALRGDDPLRAAFTTILTHDEPAPIAEAVARRVASAEDGPLRAVRIAAADFPGDVGVVLALLLNYVRLEPGEAIFLGAGNVHAYLRGSGVEIMANSDNVLRCGLTPKHVDVPELLLITDFSELAEPRWPSRGGRFDVPVADFSLTRVDVDGQTSFEDRGPCIALCVQGDVAIGDIPVHAGRAAFAVPGARTAVRGSGVVFLASVGAVT
jgi:mannose-6-phosphate isomerase